MLNIRKDKDLIEVNKPDNQNQAESQADMAPEQSSTQKPSQLLYRQWYEADPNRWSLEEDLMSRKGFSAKTYQDGRIVFTGEIMGLEVVVFLDHIYPLKPPKVFLLSEGKVLPENIINSIDGSVEIIAGEKHWDANSVTVSIIIDWLEELLRMLDSSDNNTEDSLNQNTLSG